MLLIPIIKVLERCYTVCFTLKSVPTFIRHLRYDFIQSFKRLRVVEMLLNSIYYYMHNCNLNMKLGVIVVFGLNRTGDICHHWSP